ncbi:heparan-alpha-glucosaminide N-acetyltransferase domain-containing protein [Nocardiopsis xinjiangensis]|uniref:heparan-alpha-glucosaminide N-acetyltransferase domain-containing protein n=1 Tax=Nocardiopsis xinjiangensis TaxID=124285 RepID=UPI0004774353|nr:heparan-alpha-glucosaminide N-acetyltransferase domain-containing protein [Nocardiopsis xinjiangensis]
MAENRPGAHAPKTQERTRIDGIDAARALAVLGMFVVHVSVDSFGLLDPDGAGQAVHDLVRGNSSALFAFLAGLSLALMTGRTRPVSGEPLRLVVVKVLTRALVIGMLGLMLDTLAVPVAVILTYYAGFFVLALPLAKLRAGALVSVAAGLAAVGPPLSFLLRQDLVPPRTPQGAVSSLSEFLLTGYYPAITFMVFVFAGMAVGRLDLGATAIRVRLLATGAALTASGYAGSWAALYVFGGLDRLAQGSGSSLGYPASIAEDPQLRENLREQVMDEAYSISGQVPTDSWWWLAVGTPHTGTHFEMAESVGQALLVLVACLWLAERARFLMYPLTSVGRMPLTVYTGHLFVLAVVVGVLGPMDWHTPWLLEWLVLGAVVFAVAWRLLLGRGPLERFLGLCADNTALLYQENRRERHGPPAP